MSDTLLMRELHSRSGAGIEVTLLWNEHSGRLAVLVADSASGDGFTIDVRESDRPLDVFHHPYAYAAWRGIGTGAPVPAASRAADEPFDQLAA